MNEFRDRGSPDPTSDRRLAEFSWGPPDNFLGLPPEESSFESARVVILPVPYEATVSWGGGTRYGPRALLHASRFVELYDHELDTEPYKVGIHTLPELLLPAGGPAAALEELRRVVEILLDDGKFVIMLGGEHSISAPPILAHAARMKPRSLSVLQLDAHADLRAEYEGTPYSHACVMYRVHREARLVPAGIRSLTAEERDLMRREKIPAVFGHQLSEPDWIDRVIQSLGPEVYITIDVDFFDPSVMPATGTPEPGGGTWQPTLALLERVFRERRVVGCDVVELAPIPGQPHPDFLAAKLVYKLVGFYAACRER
ncbi:N(1)-aminopropylagmatine ureohydrolase [bacterium HR33]|nr:N(1)-aminopropylagmatine ureohydrolase [bacterium HR33]